MGSSNAGIHAASFGGVWQCIVYGFGGVRMLDGKLHLHPSLLEEWDELTFTILWKGQKLLVKAGKDSVSIRNLTGTAEVEIEICGEQKIVQGELEVMM